MLRKFDLLLKPQTANKIIKLKMPKKFLSSLSHQFKYDNNSLECIYPRREPFNKRVNGKLALNVSRDKNLATLKNYYKILGLKEESSMNDIKRAYYILAKKFHPDRIDTKRSSSTETEKFKEISEAYNVLSDETKRTAYDRQGFIDQQNCSAPRTIASQKFQVSEITRKLSSILKDNSPTVESPKKSVIPALHNAGEVEITLSFLQSIQGTTKDINLKTLGPCHFCAGRNSRIGVRKAVKLCTTCKGTGVYPMLSRTVRGQGTCETCHGSRFVSESECSGCQNRGYIINDITVPVKILPGIKANDVIPIRHPDGKQKINLRVKVTDNNQFKRIGNDIYTEKELSLTEAALGGKFRVRGVYGNVLLNLESGTDSHSEKRLKGQGVKARSSIGDLIVKFIVKMPKVLTTKQRSLLTMLQRIEKTTNVDYNENAL